MPISAYLIGQNFCKNKILSRYLSWPSKKNEQTEKTKKPENYFSVDQKKKTIKPLSNNHQKKILAKNILGTFFAQNSNLTLFETGKHST